MKLFLYIFIFLLWLMNSCATAAPASVGLVDFAKGKVSAQHPNMGSRGLATKASIYGQDLVETGDQSFSVLRFKDNNKVTVRPLSRFSVSGQGSNVHLDQGSLNVESGAARMNINTKDAKVEAQNAKLEVRVCQQDCRLGLVDPHVVAKVVSRSGQVRASGKNGNRLLTEGSALYETDRLISGANSQLLAVFTDGGRISLGPDTEISIKEYRYGKTNKDRSTLQLIKGSLRSVTGQIGKSVPENYSIQTPVATMGVRGTSFDLVYPVNAKGQRGAGKGLLAQVRQGSITQKNAAGTFTLSAGKVNFIGGQQQAPTTLAAMPAASQQALGQKPEEAHANLQQLFGTQGIASYLSGTYVHVESGQVTFISESGVDKGKRLVVGKGQSAFVDEDGNIGLLDRPLVPVAPVTRLAQAGEGGSDFPGTENALMDRVADNMSSAEVKQDITYHFPGALTAMTATGPHKESIEALNNLGSTKEESFQLLKGLSQVVVDTDNGEVQINLAHDPNAGNYNYMTWGTWNGNVVSNGETLTGGHFMFGVSTQDESMPKSGTAIYNGSIRGGYKNGANIYHDLGGTVSLTANFGTQKVDGNFTFSGTGLTAGSATMTGADIVGDSIRNGYLSGHLNGTGASGTAGGKFRGPNAEEVGGSFEFSGGTQSVIGVYGAKQ